jgi:dCTP deaminase
LSFWSGERLAIELAKGLVVPFDPSRIDCASYPLAVGGEAFVTSDRFGSTGANDPVVTVLEAPPKHTLRIPPGQFAFLLTDENVSVPKNAIALISIKAKYKFQGLINVSGFHVDPGWQGKLLFSVYNAGPAEVLITQRQAMFMIVYADLDQTTGYYYKGAANHRSGIDMNLIQGMNSQVFSPLMLQRQMEELKRTVDDVERTAALWKAVTFAVTTVATVLLAVAALFATFAPATLGVVLARVIETGGYEMKPKTSDTSSTGGQAAPRSENSVLPATGTASQGPKPASSPDPLPANSPPPPRATSPQDDPKKAAPK